MPVKEENGADLVQGNTVMENTAVSCHVVTAPAKQSFFFNEYCEGVPSFSRTFVRGKHSAWTPTAKMAAPPRTVLAHQLRQSGRSPAAKPLPLLTERRIRWEEIKQRD